MRENLAILKLATSIVIAYLGLAYLGLWLMDNTVFASVVG